MRFKTVIRAFIGALVWGLLLVGLANLYFTESLEKNLPVADVAAFALGDRFEVTLESPRALGLDPGDRIHYQDAAGNLSAMGEVLGTRENPHGPGELITIWVYGYQRVMVTRDLVFHVGHGPDDFPEVLSQLLDDKTLERVKAQWDWFWSRHEDEVMAMLEETVNEAISGYIDEVEPDIRSAILDHQPRYEALFNRYFEETVQTEILPQVEAVAAPLVQERFVPLGYRIGEELYEELPVWGLIGSGLQDLLPWGDRTHVVQTFREYMDETGWAIVESHREELITALEQTARDIAYDREVTRVTHAAIEEFLRDPELADIGRSIVQQAVIDNPKTEAFLRGLWDDPALQAKFSRLGEMIEPYTYRMTNAILLDDSGTAINNNLAIVLRSQILWKDDRWLIAASDPEAFPDHDRLAPPGHTYTRAHLRLPR